MVGVMRVPALILLPLLAACALPQRAPEPLREPAPAVTDSPGPEVLRPRARPGAAPPAPAAPVATEGRLGETLAGLGAPGEAGMWLRTGLVTQPRPGRIVTATGATQAVELRPSGTAASAGSQLSLAAMRALGLPLTQLATVQVYAD